MNHVCFVTKSILLYLLTVCFQMFSGCYCYCLAHSLESPQLVDVCFLQGWIHNLPCGVGMKLNVPLVHLERLKGGFPSEKGFRKKILGVSLFVLLPQTRNDAKTDVLAKLPTTKRNHDMFDRNIWTVSFNYFT